MSTYVWLDDLADACRKSGLRVVEVPGWRNNGRPASTGGYDPEAPQVHHTGSKDTNPNSIEDDLAYATWLAEIGRAPGLPAPLCQVALDRTSTVYVCAAGRGNHAGKAKAFGGLPAGDGNELRLGIEAHNTGTEGWDHPGTDADGNPITQYQGLVRLVAALCWHYGWDVDDAAAHFETSVTGKWDPGDPEGPNGRMNMDRFRADVARMIERLKEGLDDMPEPKDLWNHELKEYDADTKAEQVPARVMLAQAHNRAGKALDVAREARQAAVATQKGVEALGDALDALVPGIKKAVRQAVAKALEDADLVPDEDEATTPTTTG